MKPNELLNDHYLNRFDAECTDIMDTELNHLNADKLLCELLNELGYTELVTKFKELEKWYA